MEEKPELSNKNPVDGRGSIPFIYNLSNLASTRLATATQPLKSNKLGMMGCITVIPALGTVLVPLEIRDTAERKGGRVKSTQR